MVRFEAAAEIRLLRTRDLIAGRSEHDSIPPGGVSHCPTRDAAAKPEQERHLACWPRAGLPDNADWRDRASGDGAAETTRRGRRVRPCRNQETDGGHQTQGFHLKQSVDPKSGPAPGPAFFKREKLTAYGQLRLVLGPVAERCPRPLPRWAAESATRLRGVKAARFRKAPVAHRLVTALSRGRRSRERAPAATAGGHLVFARWHVEGRGGSRHLGPPLGW